MLQVLNYILIYTVFILLLVAVSFYLVESIGRYVREDRAARAIKRGIAMADSAGFLAASPDASIIINQIGIIVQANRQARQLFGHAELIGLIVEMLLPEHLREIHQQHRARYFANPRVRTMGASLNLFGLHANGNVLPIEVSLSPITVAGERHALAIIREKAMQP
jgi:PAS domain S-box-containing protein